MSSAATPEWEVSDGQSRSADRSLFVPWSATTSGRLVCARPRPFIDMPRSFEPVCLAMLRPPDRSAVERISDIGKARSLLVRWSRIGAAWTTGLARECYFVTLLAPKP